MFEFLLIFAIAFGIAYLKYKAENNRQQRNIQKGVQLALEEERKKQRTENND